MTDPRTPEQIASDQRDDLIEQTRLLNLNIPGLTSELTISRRTIRTLRIVIFALSLILAISLGTIAAGVYYQKHQNNRFICVEGWADQTASRAKIIQGFSDTRLAAQDDYTIANDAYIDALDPILRLALSGKATPAQIALLTPQFHIASNTFTEASRTYKKARDAYAQALEDNPIPEEPRFTC